MGGVASFFNDALTIGTMGLVDAKKGRFYVPFSGASARAGAKAVAGSNSDLFSAFTGSTGKIKGRREAIGKAIDTPEGRMAGTAAAVASGMGTGYAAGPAAGGAVGMAVSPSMGAAAGGAVASSIAQADALNQQMPELKVEKPPDSATTAVQKAVAGASARRSRSRSQRSTILSQNFLNPSNPALKQTYGS
jgi:hypothetical protein